MDQLTRLTRIWWMSLLLGHQKTSWEAQMHSRKSIPNFPLGPLLPMIPVDGLDIGASLSKFS